jgi:hypothetical protein
MRPVEFGENLPAGTKLTLFSEDKPDRFFTVLEFTLDADLGTLLGVDFPVPSYRVHDEEERLHLLINEPDEEEWWLWRPDQKGIDGKAVFDGALVED